MLAFELFIPNNGNEFITKVKLISAELGINPNWLMSVMYAESKLKPWIQNTKYPLSNGPATGLIQFTPDTAIALGTTIDKLKVMSNVEQLDWVRKYFLPYKGKMRSYFDVYMAVFFPAAIGMPDTWIFETSKISRSSIARQNPSIDMNHDGMITVSEFKEYLYHTIPAKFRNLVFFLNREKKIIFIVVVVIVVGFIIYKMTR